jgi:hypothetical protein
MKKKSKREPVDMSGDYIALIDAMRLAGIAPLSDDFCCKLLAWLLVCGGGEEAVVLNKIMTADILEARDRLNLKSGEVPNARLLPALQGCIEECGGERGKIYPLWVGDIERRYGLTRRK